MTEQPQLFGVSEHIELPDVNLKGFSYLANFRGGLQIIGFMVRNLADPATEPIGLFYVGGTRRYIWREKYWADYDVPCGSLMAAVALRLRDTKDEGEALQWRRVLDILKEYKSDAGPTLEDQIDNANCQNRRFYRVLYQVEEET